MFRLQDNVPENYINQSRDFQMFCRLYDCINNGVRFDIDSMIYIFDPMLAKNNILKLLAARIGFFPRRELDDMMLRYIISTFPYVTKYKGTERGIRGCIDTVLKARNKLSDYVLNIDNKTYTINISIKTDFDRIALEEYLQYVIPTGYITSMSVAQGLEFTTTLEQVNIVYTYIDPNSAIAQVTDDYEDLALPTYSIQRVCANGKPVVYEQAATPTIDVKTEADGTTVTTYQYYEKEDGQIHKKIMTLTIPYVDDRQFGSITRSEVIGSGNDGTYKSHFNVGDLSKTVATYNVVGDKYEKWTVDNADNTDQNNTIDSTTGKNKSDLVKYWTAPVDNVNVHLTRVFNDLLEQSDSRTITLRLLDSTLLYDFDKKEPYIEDKNTGITLKDNEGLIKLSHIDIPNGTKLDDSSNFSPYLIDNSGTIAAINAIKSVSNIDYAVYSVNTIGAAPVKEKTEEDK